MPLIVDTWNVLHVTGVLPAELAGLDLRGLISLIRESRYRHEPIRLVCDGLPAPDAPTGRHGGVVVEHTGAVRSADAVIIATVKRTTAPRRLVVVSEDRAILREARRRRCPTIASEAFLRHLATDHTPPKPKPRPRPSSGPAARPADSNTGDPVLPRSILGEAIAIEREARAATEAEEATRLRAAEAARDADRLRLEQATKRAAEERDHDAHLESVEAELRRAVAAESADADDAHAGRRPPGVFPEDIVAEAERMAREDGDG